MVNVQFSTTATTYFTTDRSPTIIGLCTSHARNSGVSFTVKPKKIRVQLYRWMTVHLYASTSTFYARITEKSTTKDNEGITKIAYSHDVQSLYNSFQKRGFRSPVSDDSVGRSSSSNTTTVEILNIIIGFILKTLHFISSEYSS